MRADRLKLFTLLASTALSAAAAGPVFAQGAAPAGANQLQEVVVTATRQADTVNRVPLSVTAETQQALDQRSIQTVQDLSRIVPALTVSPGNNGAITNITIRGIQTTAGAPTTGVYLDDTPLTKRNLNGPGAVSNGTPSPPLFDLERVEVLRGPQGTLYGGSSEGGTVRFITPTPSLTRYSAYVRGDLATTDGGDPTYDLGVAVGGPIVMDKLGFRVSAFDRHVGGYVDHYSAYTGQETASNTNSEAVNAFRGVLLWAPTDRSRVSLGFYDSKDWLHDGSGWNLPTGSFTTPQSCYNTTLAYPSATKAVACPATAVPGQTVNGIYARPSYTYGPFNYLGPYKSLTPVAALTPSDTMSSVADLTLEYDFDHMTVKAVSSLIHDKSHSDSFDPSQITATNGIINAPGGITTTGGPSIFQPLPNFPAPGPFDSGNWRTGITEEIRFSSDANQKPLSWVGGLYYADLRSTAYYQVDEDVQDQSALLYGITPVQRYGVGVQPLGITTERYQTITDVEIAGFGEINYYVTDKLKAIAGVRWSRVSDTYFQTFEGTLNNFLVPTTTNGGLTTGSTTESPITPKAGLEYQFTDNKMVYLTAARGYRPGGVNSPVPPTVCTGLVTEGLTAADIPVTYNSDSVWSYEGGAKLRLFGNRLQLNSDAYRIDWQNVQVAISTAGCAPTYTTNAGAARSEGFEVESQALVLPGLTINASVGYDDAKYTQDALGPTPKVAGIAPSKTVNKGDPLPVPPWTVTIGGAYSFPLTAQWGGYLRGDYTYTSSYFRSPSAGVNAYAPDTRTASATYLTNIRFGVTRGGLDLNVFVNNLFNSQDYLTLSGGRSGCSVATGAACSSFTTFNPLYSATTFTPRTIGVQVAYRY